MLGTSYHVNPREREHIPRLDGPLLVVANHPLGMQDALALLQLIGSVRRDVRFLGNYSIIAQLRNHRQPVVAEKTHVATHRADQLQQRERVLHAQRMIGHHQQRTIDRVCARARAD